MAKYKTLNEAMAAGDELAESEIRYKLLAEVFEAVPQLRGNINPALEKAKAEIMRLRATEVPKQKGKLVPFDPERFRKKSTPRADNA